MRYALLEFVFDVDGMSDQGSELIAGQIQQADEMAMGHELPRELMNAVD